MSAVSAPFAAPARSFPDRRTLTPRDRLVLRAIAEAMFSQDGEVEPERLDAHLDEVDAFISSASKPLRMGLRITLFVVRLAPLLFFFRMRMIEKLSLDDRVAILTRLERSHLAGLSLAFIGWRTVMTLVFYENAKELASIGYASEERKVYKRRLPALVVVPSHAQPALPAFPALAAVAPPPEESGVRLRDGADADSEHPPAAQPVGNKVA